MIRSMLYDSKVPSTSPETHGAQIKLESPKTSPVWVPTDETMSLEEAEKQPEHQDDMIERAWIFFKEKERVETMKRIRDQYTSIHNAMERLSVLDQRLFEAAQEKDAVALFPKRFRIATETKSPLGWDYNMDRL
jgi:hypothetical protein